VTLLAAIWLATPGFAQRDLTADPGYVDLGGLGLQREEASLEIALEGPLIRMVAEAVRGEDAGFAELLDKLRAIRVQTFDLDGRDSDDILRRGEETVRQLERSGWSPVIRIREDTERVYLYLREHGDSIAGVWVMAADLTDSLTLVNIIGDFDPVELGRLGASLHIDPLEMLGEAARGARPDPEEDDR
jgi:hypothetical protein